MKRGRSLPFAAIGVLVIALGIAILIHPQISYRVGDRVQQIGPDKIRFETRKVIHFPLWFSLPILTVGGAILIGALREV